MPPSLRVAVLRDDNRVVSYLAYDRFMNTLISKVLREIPDFRRRLFLSRNRMDEEIAAAITSAALDLRKDLFAVGLKPATWLK